MLGYHWLSFAIKVLSGDSHFSTCMGEKLYSIHYEDQGTSSKYSIFTTKAIYIMTVIFTIVLTLQLCFGKFINPGPLSKSLFFFEHLLAKAN